MARKTYQEIVTKQTMNRVKAPSMPFDWSINPYRGCTHGCSFCYARPTHTFLGMHADDTFQNHILLKTNAAQALEEQLAKMAKRQRGDLEAVARQVGLVAIGTATDPYQPVEAKAQLTRECLKVLARYRIPATITTRSPLILRDLDVLRSMRITSINISVNTVNAELCRRLEPASPHPAKRLETVARLVENGLPAGIFIAPILPFLTDSASELEALIVQAKEHGARFAMPSVLRLVPEVKAWYVKALREHFPAHVPDTLALYRSAYPPEAYAETLGMRVRALLARYGLPTGITPPDWPKHEPGAIMPEHRPEEGEQLSFSFD
ncbi:radical SAM protein [Brevibacillus sp. SYP-B805]|uniref:SPL family radical SAM protein n=1 Tax=Brevibacillus sp. SYP-B805 TaxID=1578199 RepID=UPI0013EE274A|nr:radical SAM protein [Brevibacillus sp. SYP-B805]NGQ96628.1 radical SAM protein [Brevibacillus sp. SYP-B805]